MLRTVAGMDSTWPDLSRVGAEIAREVVWPGAVMRLRAARAEGLMLMGIFCDMSAAVKKEASTGLSETSREMGASPEGQIRVTTKLCVVFGM